MKFGVTQGSILGPLLFNIFINYIFLFIGDGKIDNYADDNAPYSIEMNIESLLGTLESQTNLLHQWFHINEMKSNVDKCHLIVVNNSYLSVNIGTGKVDSNDSANLLGIQIDHDLTFSEHVSKLCKKAIKITCPRKNIKIF